MKLRVAALALLMSTSVAFAQHAHGEKGPNGGPMEDVAGVHVELLAKDSTVTLNVYDESSKPISTKGYSASALITAGGNRETVALAPEGNNALRGSAKAAIPAGSTIAVTLKTAAGKSGQVRFKN